jgi:hypothetical protein
MLSRTHRMAPIGVALGTLALVAACSQPGTPVSPSSQSASAAVIGVAEREQVELCKVYAVVVGPAVTFNVSVDVGRDGDVDTTFQVVLSDGQCQEIWNGGNDSLTITEVVPTGFTPTIVRTIQQGNNPPNTEAPVSSNTITAVASGDRGDRVVFTNTGTLPPPPPPGDQGCTPGYWKQDQHFDSWTAPFTPTTLFDDVFEDAFPGLTLLDVLNLGGGGLNALGRHTVAALLNAASSGVEYPLTTTQVINGFNGVFPGGDFETLKNRWAGFNELGCPLN